jgi:hypothetical protein
MPSRSQIFLALRIEVLLQPVTNLENPDRE